MTIASNHAGPVPDSEAALLENSTPPRPPRAGHSAVFTRNSILSVCRLLVASAVALILPGYLTRRLPVAEYAAWVLIIQVSSYVNYLDFGIQSGIAKYVAEFEARGDLDGAGRRASAGLALMIFASLLSLVLMLAVAWFSPRFFHEMPTAYAGQVRLGIAAVGASLSFLLLCSIFPAIFYGLQQYLVPTVVMVVNRLLFAAVLVLSVALHWSLAAMGLVAAIANVATGAMHCQAWRKWAGQIRLRLRGLARAVIWDMLGYCSALALWAVAMLCISGLDVTIVGRYDFAQTAYYSLAVLPTNFMIAILGAALAPMMPAVSALSVHRTPGEMGALLCRTTRYAVILLLLFGIPLLAAGDPILRIWVGSGYATHTLTYLRILVLANILRNACLPYSTVLVATNAQKIATFAVIAEAGSNLLLSVYLARHIGAIGVAYGTLVGSFVSVGCHFLISMHYTRKRFLISRLRLLLSGILRPALIAVPFAILLPWWWPESVPQLSPMLWIASVFGSLVLLWYAALDAGDRKAIVAFVGRRSGSLSKT